MGPGRALAGKQARMVKAGVTVTGVLALGACVIVALGLSGEPRLLTAILAWWLASALIWWNARKFRCSPELAVCLSSVAAGVFLTLSAIEFGKVGELTSDSLFYDAVAREIASTVPLRQQLDPLAFDYVADKGIGLGGAIKSPGFYKLLGLLYTGSQSLGMDPVFLVLEVINVSSFALIGMMLMRLLLQLPVPAHRRTLVWWLWLAFMGNPFIIELIGFIRKDLVVLALFLAGLNALITGHARWLLASAAALVPLRLEQGIILALGGFIRWGWGWRLVRFLGRARAVRVVALGLPFVLAPAIAEWWMGPAPQVLAAYLNDLQGATFGLSRILQGSAWGAAIYAWAYPFPTVAPASGEEVLKSAFALLWALLTAVCLVGFGLRVLGPGSRGGSEPVWKAVEWMFLAWFVGLCVLTISSSLMLGFVVMEARYKLPWYVLAIILVGAGRATNRRGQTESQLEMEKINWRQNGVAGEN